MAEPIAVVNVSWFRSDPCIKLLIVLRLTLLALCVPTFSATVSAQFTVLHMMKSGDGINPFSRLAISGTTLYGTAVSGPGNLFKLNTDGSGSAVLQPLAFPYAGVVVSGTTLYGTTFEGGSPSFAGGSVYKINTDGSGMAVLHAFPAISMAPRGPYAGVTLVGSTLFGVTGYGGSVNDAGVIYNLNTNGTGYSVLHEFTNLAEGAPRLEVWWLRIQPCSVRPVAVV